MAQAPPPLTRVCGPRQKAAPEPRRSWHHDDVTIGWWYLAGALFTLSAVRLLRMTAKLSAAKSQCIPAMDGMASDHAARSPATALLRPLLDGPGHELRRRGLQAWPSRRHALEPPVRGRCVCRRPRHPVRATQPASPPSSVLPRRHRAINGPLHWPHRVMPGREWPPGSQRSQQFRRASRNDSQADSARSSTHQLQALVLGEVGEVLDVERRQWVITHETARGNLRVVRRSRSSAKLRVRLQLAPAPGPPGRCTAGQPDPPETRRTSTVCSAPNAGPRPTWSALRASRM